MRSCILIYNIVYNLYTLTWEGSPDPELTPTSSIVLALKVEPPAPVSQSRSAGLASAPVSVEGSSTGSSFAISYLPVPAAECEVALLEDECLLDWFVSAMAGSRPAAVAPPPRSVCGLDLLGDWTPLPIESVPAGS
jgi:hypothetical protein